MQKCQIIKLKEKREMGAEKCDKNSSCQTCSQANKCSEEEKDTHEQKRLETTMAQVKYKFMILSGKGGVVKCSVALNLAVTLAQY
jgi:Mrp family chromosome partitioning ATPase